MARRRSPSTADRAQQIDQAQQIKLAKPSDPSPPLAESFDRAARTELQAAALAWFDAHARDLPWRKTREPYRVWLSEVMLQQTQVATVIGYFERFLAEFPTVESLAAATEERVLRLWEGLGYYRRARQLHAAAQQVVAQHGGIFPRSVEDLRQLPGIGRYTAGAVASIAYDEPAPILEANTVRLLARLTAEREVVTSAGAQERLWRVAQELLPERRVGHFNQSLMEIGSLVCTPRDPRCLACPIAPFCAARKANLVELIPVAKPRPKYEEVAEAAIVVWRGGRVLIRRRGATERWAGMWDFPRFELRKDVEAVRPDGELREKTRELTGVSIEPRDRLATLRHGVTRFKITLHCFTAIARGRLSQTADPKEQRWVTPQDLSELPLSVTARKIARLIARAESR